MSKRLKRPVKKRTIAIISLVVVLVVVAGAVYLLDMRHKQQIAEQKKSLASQRSQLNETAFRGNRDLAANYMQTIKEGDVDKAYSLYTNAADEATDAATKTSLYEQAVSAAYKAKQQEHTINYAVKLTEVSDSYRASANAAALYGQNKDTENQKKYLQQALQRLETLPKDSIEYSSMKANYEAQMTNLGSE